MKGAKLVLLQMAALLVLASGVGLAANQIRWDKNRLTLSRNYFPAPKIVRPSTPADPNVESTPNEAPQSLVDADSFSESTLEHEFITIDFQGVTDLMESESFLNGLSIIIDARDDEHYLESRIPGAYQLDHYRLEEYMPKVEAIALGADLMVVYCNGGKCEDSILVARDLLDIGVLMESIRLYEGGIKDWEDNGGAVDAGETE